MAFWTFIALAALFVIKDLIRPTPRQEGQRPPGEGEFRFPTTAEDRAHPWIFGTVPLDGPNLVWYGDISSDPIRKKTGGGLFGGGSRQTVGYQNNVGMQLVVGRGLTNAEVVLTEVLIGEKSVFTGSVTTGQRFDIDEPQLFGDPETGGAGGVQATCDFYGGTLTQPVNAYLNTPERQQITVGVTQTAPRNNGMAYLVVREFTSAAPTANDRGAYVGNSTQIKAWALRAQCFPQLFSGQSLGDNIINSLDANPMNVLYEIMTNTEAGFGIADVDIDVGPGSSFALASETLREEGNGFSMPVDLPREAAELFGEIQRQISGVVYISPTTGKWTVLLTRAPDDIRWGYDINTVPQLDDDTVAETRDFSNGDWLDTTNQIHVEFSNRANNYKTTIAPAQNMANAIMLAGGSTTAPLGTPSRMRFPGVKNQTLANDIAWRELDAQGRPLRRVTLTANRVLYNVVIGSVVAWTDSTKPDINQVPMRVTEISYGTLQDPRTTVKLIEDVFYAQPASYGDPPPTLWTPPTVTLVAYPSDEIKVFEAPRGLVVRDPDFSGDETAAKVYATARRQGSEIGYDIGQRSDPVAPSGPFSFAGTVVQFALIGELAAELPGGSANPVAAVTVVPTPDSQAAIEAAFTDGLTPLDLGTNLAQLVLIGDEFALVSGATDNGPNVDLDDVFRGALDAGQQTHPAGTPVFLVFLGGDVAANSFLNTWLVDVELRSRSSTEVFSGAVTPVSLTLDKRAIRPYSPGAQLYSGSGTPFTTPDLEADGSGLNGVGFDIAIWRRRFDTADEVSELLQDNTPDASTEHRVQIYSDPDGGNSLVYDSGWFGGTTVPTFPTQAELINADAAGTELRIQSDARHDLFGETDLESWEPLIHDVVPTSPRTSQFYLGGDLRALDVSNAYTAAATGSFTINIGAAYSTSNVQVQINGGGFSTVVAAGLTTGNFAATSGDTIEVRHTTNETPDPNFVEILDPVATAVAYGAFSA